MGCYLAELKMLLIALIPAFICSFFCLFSVNYITVFSGLCELKFPNIAYTTRMSDCILGLRIRLIALIPSFLSITILSLFCI